MTSPGDSSGERHVSCPTQTAGEEVHHQLAGQGVITVAATAVGAVVAGGVVSHRPAAHTQTRYKSHVLWPGVRCDIHGGGRHGGSDCRDGGGGEAVSTGRPISYLLGGWTMEYG